MQIYSGNRTDSSRWSQFDLRSGDVIVSTPPKCGTTWTQTIVANLIFPDGDLPAPVMVLSPWIEAKMMMPADELHAHTASSLLLQSGTQRHEDVNGQLLVALDQHRQALQEFLKHAIQFLAVDGLYRLIVRDLRRQ